ncbi:MAG: PKD domain-containing protein [Thermoplasmata archaeon]
MVYDPADNMTLLFGGCPSSGTYYYSHACPALGDTWKFVNGIWTNLTATLIGPAPPARADAGIAYDAADGYVVLFGGFDGNTLYQDTWTFVGDVWSPVHPAISPPARFSPGMAYDAVDHEVVLFGGANETGSNSFNDTWTYHAGSWSLAHPANAPAPRFSLAMTYDAADRFVLLFGGWSAVQTSSFGDTWTFAGGAWIELFPAPSPSPRNYQVLTYDAALNAAVLTGGHVGSNVYNDTWAYNASDGWPLFATPSAPSPRWAQDLAYDPSSELVWQFGGFALSGSYESDTWAFGSTLQLSAHAPPTTGAAGSPVSFTAWVTGGLPPYSYGWTFGDGSPFSAVANVSHTFHAPGNYTVNVSVSTVLSTSAHDSFRIEVVSPLTISVSQNLSTFALGQSVTLTTDARQGLPPYTYTWASLPSGCASANTSVLVCIPAVAGTFAPRVTVTDDIGERATGNFSFQVTSSSSSNNLLGGLSTVWLIVLIAVAAVAVVAIVVAVAVARRSRGTPPPPPP